ncbi:hypothetical protein [Marinibacterium sp. SX1]|uniref:hypothetical protein n=1 Tax=Marinibacterium sp. SX1 TaxID=3388424 RepID=UPI003D173191
MSRAVMIGSSHTAALRMAWDAMTPEDRPFDLDFLVAPAGIFAELSMQDGHVFGLHDPDLLPTKARVSLERLNGSLTVDVASYDWVILVGHAFTDMGLLSLLEHADVDGLRAVGADQIVSRPAFDALLTASIARALPDPCWHNRTDTRVCVVQRPRQSEAALEASRKLAALNRDSTGLGEALDYCTAAATRALEPLGLALIDQPAETIGARGLTRAEFSRGSIKLNERTHDDDDNAHMNPDYGALQWREILETLGLQK